MKKICKSLMLALAEGKTLSNELEHHLEVCPDCALFKHTIQFVPDDSAVCVPEHLDTAIHKAAADRPVTLAPKWGIWKIALPIAASFAICFALAVYVYVPRASHFTPASGVPKTQTASSWSTSDFDESLITLAGDVARGCNVVTNFYDTLN